MIWVLLLLLSFGLHFHEIYFSSSSLPVCMCPLFWDWALVDSIITSSMSCHSLLAWRVSIERSALILMGIHLCVICCFFLAAFNICSLCLVFVNLINMHLGCFILGLSCLRLSGLLGLGWTRLGMRFVPFSGTSSSGDQMLGDYTVPGGPWILSTSLVPAAWFAGCAMRAPSQVCCVSPLGSWSQTATLLADVNHSGSQEDLVSN